MCIVRRLFSLSLIVFSLFCSIHAMRPFYFYCGFFRNDISFTNTLPNSRIYAHSLPFFFFTPFLAFQDTFFLHFLLLFYLAFHAATSPVLISLSCTSRLLSCYAFDLFECPVCCSCHRWLMSLLLLLFVDRHLYSPNREYLCSNSNHSHR
jgi:hypothetical protein